MTYRNWTYIAFSWNNTTDPTKSDIKYFNMIKWWNSMKGKDFSFNNSHEKTYQVRDTSHISTLKNRLSERLSKSKHLLLIITDLSIYNKWMLNWEIEKAVDNYKLPIIIVYPWDNYILAPNKLEHLWPSSLKIRINNWDAKCIHIPFKEIVISSALNQFSIHDEQISTSLNYYTKETYINWGLI